MARLQFLSFSFARRRFLFLSSARLREMERWDGRMFSYLLFHPKEFPKALLYVNPFQSTIYERFQVELTWNFKRWVEKKVPHFNIRSEAIKKHFFLCLRPGDHTMVLEVTFGAYQHGWEVLEGRNFFHFQNLRKSTQLRYARYLFAYRRYIKEIGVICDGK